MAKEKLEQITFSNISSSTPYMIKNLILTNNNENLSNISFEDPFTFEGIIFGICLKGSDKIKINFKEYTLEENSILTILPHQIVEKNDDSENLFIEILAFSPDFISGLIMPKDFELPKRIMDNPILKISPEKIQNLLRFHSFIIETFNNEHHIFFEEVIKGQLYSLLMEIASLYAEQEVKPKEKATSRNEEIVEQFFLLLKDHHKTERSATFYADKIFVTPKYLSSVLKKVTGRTINTWIDEAAVLASKILLKSTSLTVLQISEELNFPNSSNFGRFFKNYTGMTPIEYREK